MKTTTLSLPQVSDSLISVAVSKLSVELNPYETNTQIEQAFEIGNKWWGLDADANYSINKDGELKHVDFTNIRFGYEEDVILTKEQIELINVQLTTNTQIL